MMWARNVGGDALALPDDCTSYVDIGAVCGFFILSRLFSINISSISCHIYQALCRPDL